MSTEDRQAGSAGVVHSTDSQATSGNTRQLQITTTNFMWAKISRTMVLFFVFFLSSVLL